MLSEHIRTVQHVVGRRGFSGPEIVAKAYALLIENAYLCVRPKKGPTSEYEGFWSTIADDTGPGDCHSRKAYMRYMDFQVLRGSEAYYAVGLGENPAPNYYVACEYVNDIIVIPLKNLSVPSEENFLEAIVREWRHGFYTSPVIGKKDGAVQFGPDFRFQEPHPGEWLKGLAIDSYACNGVGEGKAEPRSWKKELAPFLAAQIKTHL